MKIETNNYSQPSFNATLKLKGNTKLLAENQDLILEVFAKRFGSYEDIIEFNLPKKFVKNKAKLSVTTSVNNITEERWVEKEDGDTYVWTRKYSYSYDGMFPTIQRLTYQEDDYTSQSIMYYEY